MLIVAVPGGRTFAVDPPAPGAGAAGLRAAVEKASGAPLGTQTLVDAAGAPAADGGGGGPLRVAGAALPPPPPPAAPAAADGTVTVMVKPRLQRETWSEYWKETMATKTIVLDAFPIALPPTAPLASVAAAAAARCGWAAPSDADRLPGFTAPWTTAFVRGHAVSLDASLAAAGAAAGGEVVIVRVALKKERWQVLPADDGDGGAQEEESDDETTSEEEEGGGGGLWCGI